MLGSLDPRRCYGDLGAPDLVVGVCLKNFVKAPNSALKDSDIVEGEPSLCGEVHRRIG